jgi:hypothetical protein
MLYSTGFSGDRLSVKLQPRRAMITFAYALAALVF